MAADLAQRERFATMLGELGISGKEFARRTGLSEVSVSRWRNGSRSIQSVAADEIEKAFPQFSAAWIQGKIPYRNDIEARAYYTAENAGRVYLSNHGNVAAALDLAARNGYSVKLPNESVNQDGSGRALYESIAAGLTMNGGVSIVDHDGNSKNPPVVIDHDGVTAELTLDEFQQFADELADFAAVRLARMVKRRSASENSD